MVFEANSGEKQTPTPQGLMISCKSPSAKDNRWKLSQSLNHRVHVIGFFTKVEDQPTEGLKQLGGGFKHVLFSPGSLGK